ncbi:unnamed protein product [Nezara viridula]|uniref:Neuropeptide n=1 Tax=Nezara viridula TaxID=85310 RepID=A0A9P0H8R4_NEZVI|nr:unnamed protein product [Nezara viridula]
MSRYLLIVTLIFCVHLRLGVAEGSERSLHDHRLSVDNVIIKSTEPGKPPPLGYIRCSTPRRCCQAGVTCCHGDMYCCQGITVLFKGIKC